MAKFKALLKNKKDASNNCGIICSVPGYSKYSKFMAMSGTADNIDCIRNYGETSIQDISIEDGTPVMDPITPFNFEFNSPPTQISDAKRHNNEIMQWHIRLNHLPFSKPNKQSKTPKDNIPICASCLYGRFADNAFISDVRYKNQGISYCGVNVHHQNTKAKKEYVICKTMQECL